MHSSKKESVASEICQCTLSTMTNTDVWKTYSERTAQGAARPRLIQLFKNHTIAPGIALDVGCGPGRDAKFLLQQGWQVDGLDGNESALNIAVENCIRSAGFKPLQASFEDISFRPKSYDLITASYSLPFCHPKHFSGFWKNLVESLKSGSYLSCDFFGPNDEWNTPQRTNMTFLSRAQVEKMIPGFEILNLDEKEEEAPTALGPLKHWHILSCNFRKMTSEDVPRS